MAQSLYSWSFKNTHERSQTWYIIALACVIWLVIWGILTRQYGMSFVVLLIAGVFYFVENNAEEEIIVSITELWINVWGNFYDFSRIQSFAILYDKNEAKVLRLKTNKKTLKTLDVDIDNEIAANIQAVLPNFVRQDEKWEFSFTDKVIRASKL